MSTTKEARWVLVIKAHPREDSFCNALVSAYVEGAQRNGAEVRLLSLPQMDLAPWLTYDWSANHDSLPDSPDLTKSRELIKWSQHMLFAYPIYWTAPPLEFELYDKDPAGRMMKDIFRFNGIEMKHKFYFGPVHASDAEKREEWLRHAGEAGRKDTR